MLLLPLVLAAGAHALLWRCRGADGRPAGPVREPPYHVNLDQLQLLEHVLAHEKEWRLVLDERVKGMEQPPHGLRFPDAVTAAAHVAPADASGATAADAAGSFYVPRLVAAEVVSRFSRVGTIVEFGARVVHRALECHAMRHMAFQAHYLSLLLARKVEPAVVLAEVSAFREAVVRVVDKLAAVPDAELDRVFDAYWDLVSLMQDNAVHHVRPKAYPRHARDFADRVHRDFAGRVLAHCGRPYHADRRLFADAGVAVPDELLLDDVLGAVFPVDQLVRLGRAHAAFLAREFRDLGAETMPRALWTQLFYHASRLPPSDPLNRVNPVIARQPGRGHARTATSIAVSVKA